MSKAVATFFSDPHLGLNRMSHTTPDSRARLRQQVFTRASRLKTPALTLCLGDLFDRSNNDEATILQGLEVLGGVSYCLAGNHDSRGRTGLPSSLELCAEVTRNEDFACEILFSPCYREGWFYTIPHCLTQEIFDRDLERAPAAKVLLLHSNYDAPAAAESREDALNLTRAQASGLLERFDRILIGHEHNARSDFDGRLQCVGTVFPTSFADCKTDKFVWHLHDDGGLEAERVWSTEDGYWSLTWEDLLEGTGVSIFAQFVEITGTAPAARMPEIAKAAHKLWAGCPEALMVKNSVESEAVAATGAAAVSHRAMSVPDRVSAELEGTPAGVLWQDYLRRAL